MDLLQRPRRLRSTKALRELVAETRISPSQLMYPAFVRAGITAPEPISALPGQYQHTLDSIRALARELVEAGVGGIDLFGVPLPEQKDAIGSNAWAEAGILNQGISVIREEVGDALVICADTCLDEFTSHGHCGVVRDDGTVDNDATLPLYAKMALSQVQAGAHMVSPSGMMDGQVRYIRQALDAAGFSDVAIMAYSAKYASAFFGPFREAVGSTLKGNRRTYQQDPANRKEGLREALLDISEGADIVMVKPASHYLDVVADVAAAVQVPVSAYQVSGEYAMLEAAAAKGWIDRERAIQESLISIARAGADVILTYWALEVAKRSGVER